METRIEGRIDENKLRWKKEAFFVRAGQMHCSECSAGKRTDGICQNGRLQTDGRTDNNCTSKTAPQQAGQT